jgi:hypothetical protein
MKIESPKILDGRTIITGKGYQRSVEQNLATIYIGIHNGSRFLDSLLGQIQSQTVQNFPLIIIDNFSSDESWSQILEWPTELLERAKLIRNPINLGGTGSFALNFSEVETDWFITLHQDDTYMEDHVAVLLRAIAASSTEDIVFFTDMGTQDMAGKKLFTPVRQSWVANLESPEAAFRANLLQQSVSYPSSAFRASAISPNRIPWHSSSFPDTEITLLQASLGKFKFIPTRTMLYRMNPQSESHDLNPKERVLGPFASLSRVMASESFLRLCTGVPEKQRGSFSTAVLQGIDIRLGSSPFSEIVKLIASETMGLAWDYSEDVSRTQILDTYKIAEDGRTTKLLEELGALYSGSESVKPIIQKQNLSQAQIDLEKILDEAAPPSNSQARTVQKVLLNIVGRILPLGIRRKVIGKLLQLYSSLNPQSPWNLSWKPKS